jgi:acyl-coenzyme A thioesterase PaaI-like protein
MSEPFSDAQRAELKRIVDGLRAAIGAVVSLDAPIDTLRALAEQAESLGAALAPWSGKKPFPPFPQEPGSVFPFSPATGPFNPLAPPMEIETRDGEQKRVVARMRFARAYEGPPSYVHGGVLASAYDQILAYANRANGVGGLTASLTVRYRRPTPLDTELQFESWTEEVGEQKIVARGECRAGGELLTECEGIFVRINAERAKRLWQNGVNQK